MRINGDVVWIIVFSAFNLLFLYIGLMALFSFLFGPGGGC